MKAAIQTTLWGPLLEDRDELCEILDVVAAAGYEGVEFAQRPGALGVRDIGELLELLSERALTLVGLSGGSVEERMAFCQEFRPTYLSVEELGFPAEPRVPPFRFALHPHVYKTGPSFEDVRQALQEHSTLALIPDTAHFVIAGQDPLRVIQSFLPRIVAVHLRDWSPMFGRSSHRYARGFTALGAGVVPLAAIVRALGAAEFTGWLVAEAEAPCQDPAASALECARWLADHGVLARPSTSLAPGPRPRGGLPSRPLNASARRFSEAISRASSDPSARCYESIARAFAELLPTRLVTLWNCTPAQNLMCLLATWPPLPLEHQAFDTRQVPSGVTVRSGWVEHLPLPCADGAAPTDVSGRQFSHPELLRALDLQRIISLPVLNLRNPSHVRYVVNLFPAEEEVPYTDEALFGFAQEAALVLDAELEELCGDAEVLASSQAAIASAREASAGSNPERADRALRIYLGQLLNLVQKLLDCEGVAIFLADELGTRLTLAETSGTRWRVGSDQQFYAPGQGLTGWVWQHRTYRLARSASAEAGHEHRSYEVVDHPERDDFLSMPILTHRGEAIGVIRCRNRRTLTGSSGNAAFSDDDAAVLDSILLSSVQHLEFLLAVKRRKVVYQVLLDELIHPVIRIQNETLVIQERFRGRSLFHHDFLTDIVNWARLMLRLLRHAKSGSMGGAAIEPECTRLISEVIAPAIRRVEPLLRERDFSPRSIRRPQPHQVPLLWIDRLRFQQVLFNLLSNAIKYSYDDPGAFGVEIEAQTVDDGLVLLFRDWGPGIPAGMEDRVFEEEVRGPTAHEYDVGGQGLGLWFVREIVEAHGGTVEVTRQSYPTEFEIWLPSSRLYQEGRNQG